MTGPSLALRVATSDDSRAVARVHVAAWRRAYRGIVPDSYLDALDEESRVGRYTFDQTGPDDPVTWVALEDGEVVGFATIGHTRDDAPVRGEVYALYVAPESWRSGIGAVLMARAEERLVAAGFDEASLWVLKDNSRGRRFYEACGWQHDGSELSADFDGLEVVEVRYTKTLGATSSTT